jgi:hypothetical protein
MTPDPHQTRSSTRGATVGIAVDDRTASDSPRRGAILDEADRRSPVGGRGGHGLQRFEFVWLGGTFILLTILAFLFPPSGDDWAWGSQIGIDRLHVLFADYNGRYVANLIVIALTRLPLIAPFVVAATLSAILFLIVQISRNRTAWGYALTSALVLAMPHFLWSQTISWLSGFVNYTLSTLLVLIFARAVQADWRGAFSGSRATPLRVAGTTLLAFLAGQFMENVTLFFVVASIVLLPMRKRFLGRVSADAWAWAAGSLCGAVAMFSNEAYQRAFGGGGYQQVSGIRRSVTKLLDPVSQFAIIDNLALNLALASAVLLLVSLHVRSRGGARMLVPLILVSAFIAIAFALNRAEALTVVPPAWRESGGLAALLLVASLLAVSGALSKQRRILLLASVAAVLVLVGPLAFVNPIGPRLFLVTYVILLVIVNVLFAEVTEKIGRSAVSGLAALATALTVGLLCGYFVIFISNSVVSADRLALIRRDVAEGQRHVSVPRLPFPGYMQAPEPTEGVWATRYKLFYGLPSDLKIELR